MTDRLDPMVMEAIDFLLSEAEVIQGFKNVEVDTCDMGQITVRFNIPEKARGRQLFEDYCKGLDRKGLVAKLIDTDFSGAFLDGISPDEMRWLADVCVAICVGREGLIQNQLDRAAGKHVSTN